MDRPSKEELLEAAEKLNDSMEGLYMEWVQHERFDYHYAESCLEKRRRLATVAAYLEHLAAEPKP